MQDRKLHPSFLTTGFQLTLPARLWLLYTLAAASFLTTLHLPYIGEEAVYTITSMEMWTERNFLLPTLFGSPYGYWSAGNAVVAGTAHADLVSRISAETSCEPKHTVVLRHSSVKGQS